MSETERLARQFEGHRAHLQGVAYRMLGSFTEAEDAAQDAWLKLSRADVSHIENLGGWLTTVVARGCLDMLRVRKARREQSLEAEVPASNLADDGRMDPEQETLLADSVGVALLMVLDTLAPAERLAFVLHDIFGVPFEEIASIVGRSPDAARQLASRARRRVRGSPAVPSTELTRQRALVDAFLTALRAGDLEGLLAVLDPEAVVHVDGAAGAAGGARDLRGARTWARG